jgi:hypothetical protein
LNHGLTLFYHLLSPYCHRNPLDHLITILKSAYGTSRHFAATRQIGRVGIEADLTPGL